MIILVSTTTIILVALVTLVPSWLSSPSPDDFFLRMTVICS